MNNEYLGENEHIIKEFEGARVIEEEADLEKELPHIIESDNPNKELVESKEHEQAENIKVLDTIVNTFLAIREKYSKENLPVTTDKQKAELNESRVKDNELVEGDMLELKTLYSKFETDHEKRRIDFFLEEMKNFLENNNG